MTGDGFERIPGGPAGPARAPDEHLAKQARNLQSMGAQTPQMAEATPGAQPMKPTAGPAGDGGQAQGQPVAA
jgi:hypothetical protein